MGKAKRLFEEVRQEELRKERLRDILPDWIKDKLIHNKLKEKKK